MNNDDLVKQIRNVVREEVTAEIEPVKKDLQDVKQSQAQTNTALEAVAAGQKDQATKGDIHRLETKIDKVAKDVRSQTSRIENLEEHTGTPNPHKN